MKRPQTLVMNKRLLLMAGLATTLALAGCGKRGPLEPPPDPNTPKAAEPAPDGPAILPTARSGPRRPPPIQRPNESFILDPLLD